jgi:hypothetical protein
MSCAPTCSQIKLGLSLQSHKVSFAMQNEQSPQQGFDRESRREYKSPTLRKLGKLTHMTLTVGAAGAIMDGGIGLMDKTS